MRESELGGGYGETGAKAWRISEGSGGDLRPRFPLPFSNDIYRLKKIRSVGGV